MLVLAGVLAVVVIGMVNAAVRADPIVRVRSVPAPSSNTPEATNAIGCPVRTTCAVSEVAPADLLAAFGRAFPAGKVLVGFDVRDAGDGSRLRGTLTGRIGDDQLLLTAQCVVNGLPVRSGQTETQQAHVDLSGNTVTDARLITIIAARDPGCSVAVQLGSSTLDTGKQAAAARLASDPSIQVRR
jgi:hypothetical protein